MEDLCDDFDNVLMEAIALWWNSTSWDGCFHIQSYLSGRFPLESEDDTTDFDSNNWWISFLYIVLYVRLLFYHGVASNLIFGFKT